MHVTDSGPKPVMTVGAARLDRKIAVLEDAILNAPSLEVARRLHEDLDSLRQRRGPLPDPDSSEYERGYQAGYHAAVRRR